MIEMKRSEALDRLIKVFSDRNQLPDRWVPVYSFVEGKYLSRGALDDDDLKQFACWRWNAELKLTEILHLRDEVPGPEEGLDHVDLDTY